MDVIVENIIAYKYIYLGFLALAILIIVLLVIFRPKKVKPIDVTIDDVKEEKNDIEKVIEALEANKNDRPMTTFEEEQEANAIISYQELVKAVNEKKAHMDPKPVTAIENSEVTNPVSVAVEEQPKFKNSEFISPIFGKDSNNDEFLKELKDFRSNL